MGNACLLACNPWSYILFFFFVFCFVFFVGKHNWDQAQKVQGV